MTDVKAPAAPPKKIAKLPDGQQLEFEHDYPDSMMDADVRRHMGVPDPPPSASEVLPYQQIEVLQALRQTVESLGQVLEASTRHTAMLASSVMEAVQTMREGVGHIAGVVSEASKPRPTNDGPEKAIAALSGKLDTIAERLERAMRAKKRIVTDAKGKPVGVEVVEN